MSRRLTAALAALFLVLSVADTTAQTDTPTTMAVYCIEAQTDAYDYTGDPEAFLEAVLAGDILVLRVDDPAGCVGPVADDGLAYDEYILHVLTSWSELNSEVESMGDAKGLPAQRRASARLRDWARGEQEWLADNPPLACYRTEYDLWSDGVGSIGDGAAAMVRAIDDLSVAGLRRAGETVVEGISLLGESMGTTSEC